jgi:hypothetical protein
MCLPDQVVRHSLPKHHGVVMLTKFFQQLRKELQTIGQTQKMIVESERYTKSIGQVLDDKLHLAVQSVGLEWVNGECHVLSRER